MDAEGAFTVVDRLKELIKYQGGQVAPAELEAVLLSHPDRGRRGDRGARRRGQEIPKAFVVDGPGPDAAR